MSRNAAQRLTGGHNTPRGVGATSRSTRMTRPVIDISPRVKKDAKTAARGYGSAHQRERAKWAPKVARGEVFCRRCERWIPPGHPWDLGHDDFDRSAPTHPEHRECNRATAAHRAARRPRSVLRASAESWL